MKKFHVALGVNNVEASVAEYNQRFDREADLVIPGEYALWRTPSLNISIRKISEGQPGELRHLGWEDPEATEVEVETDCNNIMWEKFTAEQQAIEIENLWPGTGDRTGFNL